MSRFVISIDLGTTNSAIAHADAGELDPAATQDAVPISIVPIPQLVGLNDVSTRPLLPSFLYVPAAKEFPLGSLELPWKSSADRVVGARPLDGRGPGVVIEKRRAVRPGVE